MSNPTEIPEFARVQGRDRRGNKILLIIGKYFPARLISSHSLGELLEKKVSPLLEADKPFSILYVHTGVGSDNCLGLSPLKSIYEAIPDRLKPLVQTVYFLHPGIQTRLFLAVFGRVMLPAGLYWKVKYVNRVEFLWDSLRRSEMELPGFVHDEDDEEEFKPVVDYGLESENSRPYCGASSDNLLCSYSMRCIA